MMRHFSFMIGLLFNIAVLGGFSAQTLVKTNDAYVPIEYLEVGDMVVCYDMENNYVEKEVVAKKTSKISDCICVSLGDTHVISSRYQYFYIADKQIWKKAEDLIPGDLLLGRSHRQIPVKQVVFIEKEIDLYDISVKDYHNFLVFQNDILVHNFAPVVAIGISWAVGAFTAEALTASLSVAVPIVGCYIGYKVNTRLQGAEFDGGNIAYADKAPGVPTKDDGFLPPKNWDGEKVKHSKSGQWGWPDNKGNVWVPSGTKGHGGPHWDVQCPRGKGYDNVYPGGRVR